MSLYNAPYILGVFPVVMHSNEIEPKFSYCPPLHFMEYPSLVRLFGHILLAFFPKQYWFSTTFWETEGWRSKVETKKKSFVSASDSFLEVENLISANSASKEKSKTRKQIANYTLITAFKGNQEEEAVWEACIFA